MDDEQRRSRSYEAGQRGEAKGYDTDEAEYRRGQADAERMGKFHDAMYDYGEGIAEGIRQRRFGRVLKEMVFWPVVAAVVAAVLALLFGQPPLAWAVPAAIGMLGFLLISLLLTASGMAIGFGLSLILVTIGRTVRFLISVSLWVIGFALLAGAIGFTLSAMAGDSTQNLPRAQQFAGYGALVGFFLGVINRAMRWSRNKSAPKEAIP